MFDLEGVHILYDRAHGEMPASYYSTLMSDVVSSGAMIDENYTFPIDETILDDYDVLWVTSDGYTSWTSAELTAVAEWLGSGGGLFVHGDNYPSTYTLLDYFDIQYAGGSYSSGNTGNLSDHPVNQGVALVYEDYDNNSLTNPATEK